jgi:hypothetical protein
MQKEKTKNLLLKQFHDLFREMDFVLSMTMNDNNTLELSTQDPSLCMYRAFDPTQGQLFRWVFSPRPDRRLLFFNYIVLVLLSDRDFGTSGMWQKHARLFTRLPLQCNWQVCGSSRILSCLF